MPWVIFTEVVGAITELDLGISGSERPDPFTELEGEFLRDFAHYRRLKLSVALAAVESYILRSERAE